ncbi:MAG: hypothetical protein AAGD01_19605 [Acidobacteriota bacterium]
MTDTHNEIEEFLNQSIGFAEQMLRKFGDFYPYAVAKRLDGEFTMMSAQGDDENPDPAELVAAFEQELREGAQKGEFVATAIVYDVTIPLPPDDVESRAIGISLDHKESESLVIYMPYELDGEQISVGETFVQEGEDKIFA